ncbi:MAG: alkaline phosphatase [Planctomycetaceae bacterium]|nr:alkaline phosphatase [Planctomycetaceae bacterium]
MRALALGAVVCGLVVVCGSTWAADGAVTISHGPMLGRLKSDGIMVWARTSGPGAFRVRYGTAPGKLDQQSQPMATGLGTDCTGVVTLSGLEPNTRYYYNVAVGDEAGRGGNFKTLNDSARLRDPKLNPEGLFNFSFEFACGNNQSPSNGAGPTLPTFDTLNRQVKGKVDFAILNGDWLYEEARDYQPEAWQQQMGVGADEVPRIVRQMPNITGVWQNYKTYLSRGKNLAQWHRHVPSYFTFDDHEILDDVFGTGEVGYRDRRATFRDIAVSAWYHYLGWSNPRPYTQGIHYGRGVMRQGSDVLEDASADFTKLRLKEMGNLHVHWGTRMAGVKIQEEAGNTDPNAGDPNAGVYEVAEVLGPHRVRVRPAARANGKVAYSVARRSYGSFRVGNCDFYLLDTRTHRMLHDKQNPKKPGLSMLGLQQRKWLMDEMKASDAEFQFVISSVNFMVPHVGGGGVALVDRPTKDDAWTVFLDERETLIDFWDSLSSRVFVLTGDLHNSYAVNVTDNVWEFASGPHNSVNHRPADEGNRPVNGKFQYGPRPCTIRWSTTAMGDIPRENRIFPHYCVVHVKNVFNNPLQRDGQRFVAYPHPHVIFSYYNGLTGELAYSETISTPMVKTTRTDGR